MMATINKAIAEAMEIHPDAIADSVKCRWISELDGKIFREVMHKNDFAGYSYPEDGDKELTAKHPYDNIYGLYLVAMSDFYSGEFESYSTSSMLFNEAYSEFCKNYLRNNMPPSYSLKNY